MLDVREQLKSPMVELCHIETAGLCRTFVVSRNFEQREYTTVDSRKLPIEEV